MKKFFTLAMLMTTVIAANAMSYKEAKSEALFLSDKMAYELNLTDRQYDAVYEINLDYLMSINGRNDLYGSWWDRRNKDLQYVLTVKQYNKYVGLSYFYRPLVWNAGHWTFNVYSRYTNRSLFYRDHPTAFARYRGGNNRIANHYADLTTPVHNNGGASSWRNNGNHNGGSSTWRITDRDNRGQGNSHFGSGRRAN